MKKCYSFSAYIIFVFTIITLHAKQSLAPSDKNKLDAQSTQHAYFSLLKQSIEECKNSPENQDGNKKTCTILKTPLAKKREEQNRHSTPVTNEKKDQVTPENNSNTVNSDNHQKTTDENTAHFETYFNEANSLFNNNDIPKAIQYYTKALALKPNCATTHLNMGICLNKLNKHQEALKYFKTAIDLNPYYIKAYLQCGLALQKLEKNQEALEVYEQALTIDTNNFDILYRIGIVLRHLSQFDKAIYYFRKAHSLKPTNTSILLELANTLNTTMTHEGAEEALEFYHAALEINPTIKEAMYNFAYTLKKLGHVEKAKIVLAKIVDNYPDYAQAHFSLSLCYLTLGNFEDGWPEYEWRWKAYQEYPKRLDRPLWDGSDPSGKRILLYAEQGLGDTLQFIRYAQLLKEHGAIVIVETQHALADILSLCNYIDILVLRGKSLPDFDVQIPLMSLPLLFKTALETVPTNIPYLSADSQLIDYWKKQLSEDKNFKIGICWQGNSQYRTQFLRQAVAAKSLNVKTFEALSKIEGVSLYNLQKVNGVEQLDELNGIMEIKTFGTDFDESHGRFMDTAAVMKNVDLIITIDTSIAHLAGGLGVPVWNLLPEPADWRWMLIDYTPWYPNMRLFRQPTQGDWESLMEIVAREVEKKVAEHQQKHGTKLKKQEQNKKIKTKAAIPDSCPNNNAITNLIQQAADGIQQTEDKKAEQPPAIMSEETVIPELRPLTEQLCFADNYLYTLEQELKQYHTHSVHDPAFITLVYKIYSIDKLKRYLKKEISHLAELF